MVTTWLRFIMSSSTAYDTVVSLFDYITGAKVLHIFDMCNTLSIKFYHFQFSVQGASLYI